MNIEELKIIINEQKADLNNIIFKRSELNIIDYKAKLIKIITGPRRAGKSYFLLSLGKEIYNNRVLYVNFDDVRLSKFKIDDFNNLIIAGNQIIKEFKTIFFDEIQNVQKWESPNP